MYNNEKQFNLKFRLVSVTTSVTDSNFKIIFGDQTEDNYGHYYASNLTFDTIDEGLEYVANNGDWKYKEFTFLPIYSYNHYYKK